MLPPLVYAWQSNTSHSHSYIEAHILLTKTEQRLRMSARKQQIVIRRVKPTQRSPRCLFSPPQRPASTQLHAWKPYSAMEAHWKLETWYGQMRCMPLWKLLEEKCTQVETWFSTMKSTIKGKSRYMWLWGLVWFIFFFIFFLMFSFEQGLTM